MKNINIRGGKIKKPHVAAPRDVGFNYNIEILYRIRTDRRTPPAI